MLRSCTCYSATLSLRKLRSARFGSAVSPWLRTLPVILKISHFEAHGHNSSVPGSTRDLYFCFQTVGRRSGGRLDEGWF